MFKLRIYPDPILRKRAKPVENFNKHLEDIVDEMFCTMYENCGIGLAAPQIGISWKVFVVNIDRNRNRESEMVFINPKIIETSGKQEGNEGCLSFPGVFVDKERPAKVVVEAVDVNNKSFKIEVDGLLARCILHEYDHCIGKVLTDDTKGNTGQKEN